MQIAEAEAPLKHGNTKSVFVGEQAIFVIWTANNSATFKPR